MKSVIKKLIVSKEGILFSIFLVVFILMSLLSPGRFLSWYNIQSMAYQLPEFGILALSMMIVIISGGINLSLTYTATLSMIVGWYGKWPISLLRGGNGIIAVSGRNCCYVGELLHCAVFFNGYVVRLHRPLHPCWPLSVL